MYLDGGKSSKSLALDRAPPFPSPRLPLSLSLSLSLLRYRCVCSVLFVAAAYFGLGGTLLIFIPRNSIALVAR
jgi:hypothetical protein